MNPQRIGVLLTLVVAHALQGCAIVGSQRATNSSEGVAYMLPKALLPVSLRDVGGALELSVGDPVSVGDTAHTYVLQRSGNLFTSDNTTLSVDPKTGLLSAADVKSDDKSLAAVVELLKSKARAEAADASTSVVVFRGLFDPGASDDDARSFNKSINDAAAKYVRRLHTDAGCGEAPQVEGCASVKKLARLIGEESFSVTIEGGQAPTAAAADCSAGLCYRLNVPHVVTLKGPLVSNSAVFALPNRSPAFVLPLERWAFVKTTHDVKLEAGVFKSVTTDRPSTALAVAAAPVDAASAVLSAAAKMVQLKIDLSGKEKALADAKVAEIKAKSALDKLLLEKGDGKAEAALLGGDGRSREALLSIRVGEAQPRDATSTLRTPLEQPAVPAAKPASAPRTSTGSQGKS